VSSNRRLVGLLGSSTVDQILSALSNFAITVAVVRGGGPDALGRYAVAFAVYLVVLPLTRALVSEPMLASPQTVCDDRVARSSATVVLSVAVLSAVLVCGVGCWSERPELVALALALPVTLTQDVLRYQAFWMRRPDLAVLLDSGWLLGAVLAWPIIAARPSPDVAILCWAGASGLGMVMAIPRLRLRVTTLREACQWWRNDARSLAAPMAMESVVFAVSAQLVIFAVASALSAGDLGVLRAGQVYFMPVALTLSGCASVGIPYFAQRSTPIMALTVRILSAGIVLFAVAASALIIVAEPVLHALLYARTVEVPRALLFPIAAQVICSTFAQVFVIIAKAQRRGKDLLVTRVSSTVIGCLLLVPAIEIWRIEGAAWLLAVQAALYAVHLSTLSRLKINQAAAAAAPIPVVGSASELGSSAVLTVSVIIPVHNGEAHVGDAVRSVLNQTYADLEVLVVDDGSSDGTADVVTRFQDPRVRLLRQEQRGVAGARNSGLREASGELVAFLDHDDVWFPDKLAIQLPVFVDVEVD
jgi:O-antigen/teichoic acid export membrane protein